MSGSFRVRIEARHRVVALAKCSRNESWPAREIGLRQQGIESPFPVSPRGKPGRDGSPHAGSTPRASKKRCHAAMLPAPPTKRAAAPLCIPCEHRVRIHNQCSKENIRETKKDGRHVVLDFYDLLIEPIMKRILSGVL